VDEDLHNFSADYDLTLIARHTGFQTAGRASPPRPGEPFRRMWRYYLLSCAGAFRVRDIQFWQWGLAKRGIPGSYRRPA
jgi:cyclopropane-fatty-acyl-phospholipid synthase